MIAFEVSINGEKKCVAGNADTKVLSAILDGNPRHRNPSMSVGGIIGEDHVGWLRSELKIGDEITIRIVETDVADEPVDFSRSQTRAEKEREIEEYLRSAQENLPGDSRGIGDASLGLFEQRMTEKHWMAAMEILESLGQSRDAPAEFWGVLGSVAGLQSEYEDCGRYRKLEKAAKQSTTP